MAEIAAAEGIRPEAMNAFVELMTKKAYLGWLFAAIPAIRDRALADPTFLFKLGVEVLGDVVLSIASEVTGRNEHFWDEAEYFFSDVAATVCLNGAVLTMLPRAWDLDTTGPTTEAPGSSEKGPPERRAS